MKNAPSNDEDRLTRWIDGELSDADVRDLLDADPSLLEMKAEAQAIGTDLRQEFSAEETVPYADFFNHQLRQRIEEEGATNGAPVTWREEAQVLPMFTRLRTAFGLAFVAMVAGVLGYTALQANRGASQTQVVRAFAPDANVIATAYWNDSAKATVLTLDGLEPIATTETVAGVTAPIDPDFEWQLTERSTLLATLTF
jgi:negative regulator of sigma E activity